MKIGIVVSEYNRTITTALLDSCVKRLGELGVPKKIRDGRPRPRRF